MDAASLFSIVRSSVLVVAFLSNAVLMDDTPPVKAPCNDCDHAACQVAQDSVEVATCSACCSESMACPGSCSASLAECAEIESNSETQSLTVTFVRLDQDNPCCEQRTVVATGDEFSFITLSDWMGRLLSPPKKISARLAIHGVVPELKLDQTVSCPLTLTIGGNCFHLDDNAVEGKDCCEQEGHLEVIEESKEPIVEVPAAPPLPPSYQFTSIERAVDSDSDGDPVFEALRGTRVEVPVSALVSLMVSNAETSTRLELTEELLEQQSAFSDRMLALAEHNAQLRTQIAALEARQKISDQVATSLAEHAELALHLATSPTRSHSTSDAASECSTETGLRATAIQEDLANIRRQIALLKRHSPVPFAPSYVGTLGAYHEPDASSRTGRVMPYVPVSPVDCASQGVTPCTEPKPVGN